MKESKQLLYSPYKRVVVSQLSDCYLVINESVRSPTKKLINKYKLYDIKYR